MTADPGRAAELFQLDPATCRALLVTQCVGRVVIGGDDPSVTPVNFTATDGVISFRTTASSAAARARPQHVLFEVDVIDTRTRSGWSVIVSGPLIHVEGASAEVATWAPGERDVAMAVHIERVSGRLLRGAVEAPSHDVGGYL